jgi:hypothetical protein
MCCQNANNIANPKLDRIVQGMKTYRPSVAIPLPLPINMLVQSMPPHPKSLALYLEWTTSTLLSAGLEAVLELS